MQCAVVTREAIVLSDKASPLNPDAQQCWLCQLAYQYSAVGLCGRKPGFCKRRDWKKIEGVSVMARGKRGCWGTQKRSVTWCTLLAVAGRLVCCGLCRGGNNQRICFSGIGSLSHHVVSGPSSQVLNGCVVELFIPFLQQEGNSLWHGEHGFPGGLPKAYLKAHLLELAGLGMSEMSLLPPLGPRLAFSHGLQ